ncbi:PIN domain-containing protein [Marinoscillum sp. MHG1-6]|uniref:PIN domain-containing protein n=1 Tax=Marinoscillum sp. MHG1-6 TaxID=2959627 RepID=UPI00215882BE|nr:PIN domain-containing protein [Marinoscillum sp. MHG1-6]
MSTAKILVDSSVWIDFFRNSEKHVLDDLIPEGLICTNELILTELLPSIRKLGFQEAADSLSAIDLIPLTIDWELLRKYQEINLKNGINKIGIPDLIILQQVIDHNLSLMTHDKHFHLMKVHFDFDLVAF